MKALMLSTRHFGIITVVLWASFLIYLPPFHTMPDMFRQELTFAFSKSYGLVIIGVASGLLILYRYQIGRIIALSLAVIIIFSRFTALFPNVSQKLYVNYVFMLQQKPFMVIHNDVILPLFMVFTIPFFMTNKIQTTPSRTYNT
jgi:hypothetical protein